MFQPVYTSSRLYVVPMEARSRTFFPASHEPRYVVGLRVFSLAEIAADPEAPSVEPFASSALFGMVTLVGAVTMAPNVMNLPARRLSNANIADKSKAAGNPFNSHGTGPVVFPLKPRERTDVAASWVFNETGLKGSLFVELFYNDAWPR